MPYGVLTNADNKPYHSVTWQPRAGVRIASVSTAARDYYVLSGRSLIEVEKNAARTLQLSLLGGLLALIVLAGTWRLSGSAGTRR